MGSSFDAGDHAFASYGPVSNDDLLQYYGFVERDNPNDAYVLEDMGKWLREVREMHLVCYPCNSTSILFCPGGFQLLRSIAVVAKNVPAALLQRVLLETSVAYFLLCVPRHFTRRIVIPKHMHANTDGR